MCFLTALQTCNWCPSSQPKRHMKGHTLKACEIPLPGFLGGWHLCIIVQTGPHFMNTCVSMCMYQEGYILQAQETLLDGRQAVKY